MQERFSIGEMARRAGVRPTTLRYYEAIGLLPSPVRAPNGYRLYPPATLDVLRFIRAAKAAGFTLAELREVLRLRRAGQEPCGRIRAILDRKVADLQRSIDDLLLLEQNLETLRGAFRSGARKRPAAAVCPYLEAGPRVDSAASRPVPVRRLRPSSPRR